MYQNVCFLVYTFEHVWVDWNGFVAYDDLESIQQKTINLWKFKARKIDFSFIVIRG